MYSQAKVNGGGVCRCWLGAEDGGEHVRRRSVDGGET